jgi:hypothetical protein
VSTLRSPTAARQLGSRRGGDSARLCSLRGKEFRRVIEHFLHVAFAQTARKRGESLRIFGSKLDLAAISSALGIEPTSVRRAGSPMFTVSMT